VALRRARTSIDGLPVLNRPDGRGSEDTGWLALHSVDRKDVRRLWDSDPTLDVVPSAMVL
jgi:hypothetical protein